MNRGFSSLSEEGRCSLSFVTLRDGTVSDLRG